MDGKEMGMGIMVRDIAYQRQSSNMEFYRV